MNYIYLNDSSFLKQIDLQRNKKQFVKIIVLDWNERSLQEFQGNVTGGTININGSSTIRRTANLTCIIQDYYNKVTNPNNLLSLNKKISIELGLENTTEYYTDYPILWFPLGVYIISSLTVNQSTNGANISLQLKDKMCLLNGDCGGTLPASVTFNEIESIDEDGNIVITYPTLYQIIQEAVNHWGGEQLSKIIINDLDNKIKQVMKWTGSVPIYRYQYRDSIKKDWTYKLTTNYNDLQTRKVDDSNLFQYTTYSYGDDIGYIYTDFIYTGDELIGDAGNTVTDILDKIKNLLGNYEYFYDVNGNFVFQEIKNYLNTSQSTVVLNELNNNSYKVQQSLGKAVYQFNDSTLVTSYANTPKFDMIKNDFIVWGIKETATGIKKSIRYHLAIDKKPVTGQTYQVFQYTDPDDSLIKAKYPLVFKQKSYFPKQGKSDIFYLAQDTNCIYKWDALNKEYVQLDVQLQSIKSNDWRTDLYLQGVDAEPFGTDSNYYYTELKNEWPKLYNIWDSSPNFYSDILTTPNNADFFLDFIDAPSSKLGTLSVSNIGRRTKVLVDDSINCIFAPEIPDWILIETNQDDTEARRIEANKKGQKYIQVDENIYSAFAVGGNFNSAYDAVKNLLYQYTNYNENITLQTVPIYYLDVNTRINVVNTNSDINGDYIINSISIPLDLNNTMTISATRALEKI